MSDLLTTLRSVRVGQFAVFDFASAFTGMYYLAPHIGISRERALWLTLPVGVATHAVLGIETPFNKMVLGEHPNRLAQLVIAIALYKSIFCCRDE